MGKPGLITGSLKQLSEDQYDCFLPGRNTLSTLVKEIEWWADIRESVLGLVILDLIDQDWSYVVQGRDQTGLFRAIDLAVSLPTQEQAREELHTAMLRCVDTGKRIWRQPQSSGLKSRLNALILSMCLEGT